MSDSPSLNPKRTYWIAGISVGVVLLVVAAILITLWQLGLLGRSHSTPSPATPSSSPTQETTSSFEKMLHAPDNDDELIQVMSELPHEAVVPVPTAAMPPLPTWSLYVGHVFLLPMGAEVDTKPCVQQLRLPEGIPCEKLVQIKQANPQLTDLLSHLACLTKALKLPHKRNVCIVDSRFRLSSPVEKMLSQLEVVTTTWGTRWDVVVMDQITGEVQPLAGHESLGRLLTLGDSAATCLLINSHYIPSLVDLYIGRLKQALKDKPDDAVLLNVQHEAVLRDTWLGVDLPIPQSSDRLRVLRLAVIVRVSTLSASLLPYRNLAYLFREIHQKFAKGHAIDLFPLSASHLEPQVSDEGLLVTPWTGEDVVTALREHETDLVATYDAIFAIDDSLRIQELVPAQRLLSYQVIDSQPMLVGGVTRPLLDYLLRGISPPSIFYQQPNESLPANILHRYLPASDYDPTA